MIPYLHGPNLRVLVQSFQYKRAHLQKTACSRGPQVFGVAEDNSVPNYLTPPTYKSQGLRVVKCTTGSLPHVLLLLTIGTTTLLLIFHLCLLLLFLLTEMKVKDLAGSETAGNPPFPPSAVTCVSSLLY